ncbi:putative phosphatidate phosphatase isoform X2 [Odontomachus brunneus]|uniref:putative phosphatidate phosphatase isoform X2 n=1 Tax=Odontomachus brunneus TaxID=486640 RepID=UPI0013F28DE8|nr:putative phosphatidate phosphatase isoform X2 [Odontomachus brunneus]
MDRSSKLLLRKVIVDFLFLAVLGISVLMFFLFGKPYKRGFFCNDESLYHPYHGSTVTSPMLYVVGIFLPVFSMFIGEYLHARRCTEQTGKVLFGYSVPLWMCNAYEKIGVFLFGTACTVLLTDIAKYTIGRLRPHFMMVCVPNVNCSSIENQHRYIEDFVCTASNITARKLKEIRLSFPSGHSSFSAYTMIYLAVYFQLRIRWEGSKLLKHFLQLICLITAWFTAMSRISDYKHHWSDVLAGSTLGVIMAVLVIYCIANLFAKEKSESTEKRQPTDYETEIGMQDESSPLQLDSRTQMYGGIKNDRRCERPIRHSCHRSS